MASAKDLSILGAGSPSLGGVLSTPKILSKIVCEPKLITGSLVLLDAIESTNLFITSTDPLDRLLTNNGAVTNKLPSCTANACT